MESLGATTNADALAVESSSITLGSNLDGGTIFQMRVASPSTYKVVYNPETKMLTLTPAETTYYLVYNGDEANKQQLTYDAENLYFTLEKTLEQGVPFYIVNDEGTKFGFWEDVTVSPSEPGNSGSVIIVEISPALTSIQLEKCNANFTIGIPGTYKISIDADNKMMTVSGFKKYYYWPAPGWTIYYLTEFVQSKVTVSAYLLGDVNADGVVDISDYISEANYIHGNIAPDFVFKAGDIDNSGAIDITDYIGISNMIHTGSPLGTSAAGAKAAVFELEEVSELDPE